MNEKIKQEALLSDEEINLLLDRPVIEFGVKSVLLGLEELDEIKQAQIDNLLKNKKVRVEADDQKLPENPYFETKLIPLSEGYIGYKQAQQDMLKEGWRKVKKE